MATTVARQIKKDYPGCHLTWAISHKCKRVLENNPHVDDIWSITYAPHELPYGDVWHKTRIESLRRQKEGQFDLVFFTQIYPENFNNFDGTTRSSIFRSYPGKITVPVEPVLNLSDEEVEHVAQFAARHALQRYKHVILFECSPASNQSPLDPEKALRVSARIVEARPDTGIIVSSDRPLRAAVPGIFDGSALSFRENAELSKYCTLLIGCSSGITWLLTSSWAKKIPAIQVLNKNPRCWYSFASVKYDHQFWGLNTDHILETDRHSDTDLADLLQKYLRQGDFEGMQDAAFMPSIEQIHDLYRMTGSELDVTRVLKNFIDRNRQVCVNRASFYAGLLIYEVRSWMAAVARSSRMSTKQIRRLACWVGDEVSSRKASR